MSVSTVTTGTTTADAVMRLTLVHAGDNASFTLNIDGVNTAAISRPGNTGQWSTQIANAINAAKGWDATTGVTVRVADPALVGFNPGVQVFDIVFSGTSVAKKPFDVITANGLNLTAKPEALTSLFTLQSAASAVEYSTLSTDALRRLSFAGVAGGTVTFGNGAGTNSSALSLDTLTASSLQAALVAMYKVGNASVSTADVTVTAVQGLSRTFDIRFQGLLSGANLPALKVSLSGTNEVQRLSLSQVASGNLGFGITLGGKFFESDGFAYADLSADKIKTDLLALFRQSIPNFADTNLSVTAVAGKSGTFDIEFKGIYAQAAAPKLVVNPTGLVSGFSGSYANLQALGFSVSGQDQTVSTVTTFTSFNELMARLQQTLNVTIGKGDLNFKVNPRYDAATNSLLFDLSLQPLAQVQGVKLTVGGDLGSLKGLNTSANLDLSSQVAWSTTIGLDMGKLNGFSLRAGGAYQTTIKSTTAPASDGKLDGEARFTLTIGGDDYIVYNAATGELFYDATGNGSGTTNAQLFATLSNKPQDLTAQQFVVI